MRQRASKDDKRKSSNADAVASNNGTASFRPPPFQLKGAEEDIPEFRVKAAQRQTAPATGKEEEKTPEKADQTTPVAETEEKEKYTISKGFVQLGLEGEFSGYLDVRKPHMPENLAVFRKLTEEEKTDKEFKETRYKKDDNDRFQTSGSGAYKRVKKSSTYKTSSYTEKLEEGQTLGTYPNNSGLTIGFGLDLGAKYKTTEKATAKAKLVKAGISDDSADKLADAVGLRGVKAAKKTAELRGSITITKDQAFSLLNDTIPDYEKNFTPGTYHEVVEDTMTYLNYWKGNGGGIKYATAIKAACEGKEKSEQIKAAKIVIDKYVKGSNPFSKISKILGELIYQQDAGKEIEVSDKVKTVEGMGKDDDNTTRLIDDSLKKKFTKQVTGKNLVRLIKKSVGIGKTNDAADVKAIVDKLHELEVITEAEKTSLSATTLDEKLLGEVIIRYQKRVFKNIKDGKISEGGTTEWKLYRNEKGTVPAETK